MPFFQWDVVLALVWLRALLVQDLQVILVLRFPVWSVADC